MKKTVLAISLGLILLQVLPAQEIYINEIMSNNQDIIDEDGEQDDWFELYNASPDVVNLVGWYLTDDLEEPDKYKFETDFYIESNGFQLLWADGDDEDNFTNHVSFKLSSEGEDLALFRKEGNDFILVDHVTFPDLQANTSYGRSADGGEEWQKFGQYSPNASNAENLPINTASVEFSLPHGFYPTGINLSLSTLVPNAELRYTVDGSRPNENSILYTEPITLDISQFIRASIFIEGFAPTRPTGNFYLIENTHQLPVMHLHTDADNLWDDEKGIYVIGTNGKQGNCISENRNWNQEWKRDGKAIFYESNGTIGFEKEVELKISGGCSRRQSMKSFNVFLKDNETTDYQLFPQLPYTNYRRFKLRNSGSDYTQTMLRDGAIHEMLRREIDIDLMAYRPVVVYLNGVYFGVYGLREFFNEDYIEQHYGITGTDMVRNPWMYYQEVKEGDAIVCDEFNEWVEENDLSTPENFTYLKKNVDINQMINYWLVEMYISNYDWPDNNMMIWRDRNDLNAKWRWMLYDLDSSTKYGAASSLPEYNSLTHALYPNSEFWPNRPPSTLWLRKLIENEAFLNEFSQRHLSFGQILFATNRVDNIVDSIANSFRAEMPAHIEFWNNAPEEWSMDDRLPSGGSVENWEDFLVNYKYFFADRFSYIPEHYEERLQFEGTFSLEINHDESSGGKVFFHENKMEVPHNYRGEYFKKRPLRIEAVANEGYVFVKWQENGNRNARLDFISEASQTLTPIFVKETDFLSSESGLQMEIYPNPAQDFFIIEAANATKKNAKYILHNAIGQFIFSKEIELENFPEEHRIDTSLLSNGIYFLTFETDIEQQIQKIIINR
ncbi:MAG: hypothetical protein ACI85O_002630 [Saprospiraceae bacterium]|jgi:hypothetical protein